MEIRDAFYQLVKRVTDWQMVYRACQAPYLFISFTTLFEAMCDLESLCHTFYAICVFTGALGVQYVTL